MRVPDAGAGVRRCRNFAVAACNWVAAGERELCESCELTRTRPADGHGTALAGFAEAEAAKRRLVFELRELRLPIRSRRADDGGVAFDMLSSEHEAVTTGHAAGIITLDLDETDPVHRERMRVRLGEPYRTVLGHLRHEIGHYYEAILLTAGGAGRARSRVLFGDERADYSTAMSRYYEQGPAPGWERTHVSAYATMHPWEDWAETFAHYLHLRDALQTASSYGVRVEGPDVAVTDVAPLHSEPEEPAESFRELLDAWIPLTYALNALTRSMGESDLYPFVLTGAVVAKLAFIHELVEQTRTNGER
jgi:hypothetical protein